MGLGMGPLHSLPNFPGPLLFRMAAPTIPAKATWADIAPHYAELSARKLDSTSIRAWLEDFSALDEAVDEQFALAMIAYTSDTRHT